MKKIDRYNLINKISIELQATMNTTGINVFLGGFGAGTEAVDIVPSKRVYVANLLSDASDEIIIEIAQELEIEIPSTNSKNTNEFQAFLTAGGLKAASHDFDRALSVVASDPEQAIGNSCSTLESICKAILDAFHEPYPKDQSLQPLLKLVFEIMSLSPEGHADPDIKRVLGGLLNAALGIGVLRTKFSSFHGKGNDQKLKRLTQRHARLAVNSASSIGLFLVETYVERFKSAT